MAYTSTHHPVIWTISHSPVLWAGIVVALGVLIAWLGLHYGLALSELPGSVDPNLAP